MHITWLNPLYVGPDVFWQQLFPMNIAACFLVYYIYNTIIIARYTFSPYAVSLGPEWRLRVFYLGSLPQNSDVDTDVSADKLRNVVTVHWACS